VTLRSEMATSEVTEGYYADRNMHEGVADLLVHVAVGVVALGHLAHDDQVERARGAGGRAGRADVRVKVELGAHEGRDVDAALLDRGIGGSVAGAEDYAVIAGKAGDQVGAQRGAVLGQAVEADDVVLEDQAEAAGAVQRGQHLHGGGGDLRADAVARQHENFHCLVLPSTGGFLHGRLIPGLTL